MEEKYKDKYRTTSARLNGWDYGSNGLYFITICTKDKVNYFGEIDETLHHHKTEIEEVANNYWLQIPTHFPFVDLDEFVIMPDHMHGILFINNNSKEGWQLNTFGKQTQNLASIIRGYKASVKRYANLNKIDFEWQSGYYDRVVRNDKELLNIRQYIYDNPEKWLLKKSEEM